MEDQKSLDLKLLSVYNSFNTKFEDSKFFNSLQTVENKTNIDDKTQYSSRN